jgi:Dirigent-like protein
MIQPDIDTNGTGALQGQTILYTVRTQVVEDEPSSSRRRGMIAKEGKMRRKVAVLGVLTSVLAVGVMIATLLPASSATTIKVYEKLNKGFEKGINVDGKRSIAGDYLVYTRALHRARSGAKVGRNVAQLTFIQALGRQNARFRAAATFKFSGGTLEVAGASTFSKLENGAKFSITGGTGAYNGATGTVIVRNTRYRTHFTFNVIP